MKSKCKICKRKTENIFNIKFKATPICEECATAIFLQQTNWYIRKEMFKDKKWITPAKEEINNS